MNPNETTRRALVAGLALASIAGVPALAGATPMSEALARAIERHRAAQAAYDAWPDRSDDENLNRFCIAAGDALSDLAETPCANDAEFLTKLRYLLAAEMHVIGEAPIGNQEYGSPLKAAYLHFNPEA